MNCFLISIRHPKLVCSDHLSYWIAPEYADTTSVDEVGFVPSSDENVVIFSAHQRSTVAGDSLRTTAVDTSFEPEGLQTTSPYALEETSTPTAIYNEPDFHTLLGQLQMDKNSAQQQANSVRGAEDPRQRLKAELTWRMSCEELKKRYTDQQRTLLPLPSGAEGPGLIVTGPPMTPPLGSCSLFARALSAAPRGPPLGIDTSCKSSSL